MKAEILCVGTEILLGDIVNTNAAFIAKELASIGINVYHQEVIGDNSERLKETLEMAFGRSDILIMTGGLGPTYDDLTKETVAEYFGLELELDEPSLVHIKECLKRYKKAMTKNNEKQAWFPKGATIFKNGHGTAPGFAVEKDGKTAILMPGPPREMQPMMLESVIPYLRKDSDKVLVSRSIHVFNMGESRVEAILKDKMVAYQNPTLAPYAKDGEVMLRVTARAASKEEALGLIEPVVAEVKDILGKYVYGVDVGTLQNAVVQKLREKHLKVATAESCTGGYLSKRITEVAGSSEVFECGVCTYANHIKHQILGVSQSTLDAYGAVSQQTAAEMAKGVRELAGADIGVSITGIAGPGGGTEQKPVGLVYVGIDTERHSEVLELNLNRDEKNQRDLIRYLAASHGLHLILRTVEQYY